MPIRVRAQRRLGPLRLTITQHGLSSVGVRTGRVSWRLWSRTGARPGLTSVNLPGPLSWRPAQPRTAAGRAAARRRGLWRHGLLAVVLLAVLAVAVAHGVDGRPLVVLAGAATVSAVTWAHRRRS